MLATTARRRLALAALARSGGPKSLASYLEAATLSGYGIAALPSRSYSSRNGDSAQNNAEQSGRNAAESADKPRIFPTSRASIRPNPHAAPLFANAKRTSRRDGSERGSSPSSQTPTASRSKELLTLRNSTTDPALKQLYTELGIAVDRNNVAGAIDICASISGHVAESPSSSSAPALLPEDSLRGVYHLLLQCFAHNAMLDEAMGVLTDMERCDVSPNVETLNHVLKAAVLVGDEDAIDDMLSRIRQLPSVARPLAPSPTPAARRIKGSNTLQAAKDLFFASPSSRASSVEPAAPARAPISPLGAEFTRNWTSATYQHMILSAKASHNAEFCLALMAACLRDGVALEHEALRNVIAVCLHVREFRLAAELANEAERGGLRDHSEEASSSGTVSRRLPPSLWMKILRACVDGGYMPGIELAWQKAVVDGLLVPEEGLVLGALNAASRDGCAPFCLVMLRHLFPGIDDLLRTGRSGAKGSALAAGGILHEWHLSPLFEAQCRNHEYGEAIKTLSIMKRLGHPMSESMSAWMSAGCYQDKDMLDRAVKGLLSLGRNRDFGVSTFAVNAVIGAAVWNGNMDLAMSIYEASWDLFDADQSNRAGGGAADVVPMHKKAQGKASKSVEKRKDEQDTLQAEQAEQAQQSEGQGGGVRVRPDLGTFHHLFSGCIDIKDRDLGGRLIADLNALSLQPTMLTYERLVLLCLTQDSYEDAFGFMEQAKVNGLRPSRKSYEGILRKCFSVNDERWRLALEDMKEAKMYPNRSLCRQLGIEEQVWWPKGTAAAMPRRV